MALPGALFADDSLLKLELSGPLQPLLEQREERPEIGFTLRAQGREHAVTLRARGNSRLRLCDFPPLRITFVGDDTRDSVFEGQRQLKFVSHCDREGAERYDVREEYAAYRIFNLLTDASYRVRLLQVTWEDTGGAAAGDEAIHYGFLIEPAASLSARLAAAPASVPGVVLSALDKPQAALVYVFQYLVGNTDWSLATAHGETACCHNVDLFERDGRLVAVPYDFDLSGLVDARYAKPDPSLRLRSVTQRRYRGYCMAREPLARALELVRERGPAVLRVASGLPGLSARVQQRKARFLGKFFREAADSERLLRRFEGRCL